MRREQRGSFGQSYKVPARSGDGTLARHKFHAVTLADFLRLAKQNASDLSRLPDVRATTRRNIEIVDVDQSEFITLSRRYLPQAELLCFGARDKTDIDETILQDDFVGETLSGFDLFLGQAQSIKVDGAIIVGHVERYRGHVKKPHESSGQYMLPRMLLHVIAPPNNVDFTSDTASRSQLSYRSF